MATYQAVLDALGDATRRQIVESLQSGPATVATLADRLPITRPAVSQHLRVLRDSGLVTFEQIGTRHVYRVDTAGLQTLRSWLDACWDSALAGFAAHAEASYRKEEPS